MNEFQVSLSDKSIFLAKLSFPFSVDCERAEMSHLRHPFSFRPLCYIKPRTCPWGGNICRACWNTWMQIRDLFQNVYCLLLFFTNKNVQKVCFGLNFTVSFPFGAHHEVRSALVHLLYDYPGLKMGEERRFELLYVKLISAKQQQHIIAFSDTWSRLESDIWNTMGFALTYEVLQLFNQKNKIKFCSLACLKLSTELGQGCTAGEGECQLVKLLLSSSQHGWKVKQLPSRNCKKLLFGKLYYQEQVLNNITPQLNLHQKYTHISRYSHKQSTQHRKHEYVQ